MNERKRWLRRLSLIGVVVLPSFMATCTSGMSSLQISTMNAPVDTPASDGANTEIRAA